MRRSGNRALARWALALLGCASIAASPLPHVRLIPLSRTTWDSVYTLNQAARGETTYTKVCSRCHRAALGGGDESPPLAGSTFLANWNDLSVFDLHDRIRTTMPPDTVGAITKEGITDVIAHILKANGFPAGAADLPTDSTLKEIAIKSARP